MSQDNEVLDLRIKRLKEKKETNTQRIFFSAASRYAQDLNADAYAETVVYDVERLGIIVNEHPSSKKPQALSSNYFVGTDENGEQVYFRLPMGARITFDEEGGTYISGRIISLSGATVTGNMMAAGFDLHEYLDAAKSRDSIYNLIKRKNVLDVDPDNPTIRFIPGGSSWLVLVLIAGAAFALCTYVLIRHAGDIHLQITLLENEKRSNEIRAASERAQEILRRSRELEAQRREKENRNKIRNEQIKRSRELVFDDSVATIDRQMLRRHQDIVSAVIPEGVTEIGEYAFTDCKNLESVALPSTLMRIGEGAFAGCPLESVTIGGRIETIGASAFEDCRKLRVVEIAERAPLTRIERTVFRSCENLETVYLPKGVTEIGEAAFSCCGRLAVISLSASLAEIGERAFLSCRELKRFDTGSLRRIPAEAFAYCEKLETVKFRSPLEVIGGMAFKRCALSSVTFPDTLRAVCPQAFAECAALTKVHVQGKWFIPHETMFPGTPWSRQKRKKRAKAIEPADLKSVFPQLEIRGGQLIREDERGCCRMTQPAAFELAALGKNPLQRLAIELHTGRLVVQTSGEAGVTQTAPVSRDEALRLLDALPAGEATSEDAMALCRLLPCDDWRGILLGAPVTRSSYYLYLREMLEGKAFRRPDMPQEAEVYLSASAAMLISWDDVDSCAVTLVPQEGGAAVRKIRISFGADAQIVQTEDGERTGWLRMTQEEERYLRALLAGCRMGDRKDLENVGKETPTCTLRIECRGMTFVQSFRDGTEDGADKVLWVYDQAEKLVCRTLCFAA